MKRLLIALLIFGAAANAARAAYTVENLTPTNVSATTVKLRADVEFPVAYPNTTAECYFAWGFADGGVTSFTNWDNSSIAAYRKYAGEYSLTLTDLTPSTTYYYRAFVYITTQNVIDADIWMTNVETFATLSQYPTNVPTWSNQTVMTDPDGVLVTPTNFFQINGVTPTQDITALTAAVVSNAATIAAIIAGQPITSRTVIAAVPGDVGAQLVANPELLSNWGWTIGSGGSWNSDNGGRVLVPAGNSCVVSPSNGIAYQAGWGLKIWYSNDLPSTGSLVFAVSGDTQIRDLAVGSRDLLLWPTATGTLTVTINATNGDTSVQAIYMAQVTNGSGRFAGPILSSQVTASEVVAKHITYGDHNGHHWTNVVVPARYIEHGNGTVLDTETGLMWPQNLGITGLVTRGILNAILGDWNARTNLGYSDWRIPTVHQTNGSVGSFGDGCLDPPELDTLFAANGITSNGWLGPCAPFTNAQALYVWTDTIADNFGSAYFRVLNPDNGTLNAYASVGGAASVILVRGGRAIEREFGMIGNSFGNINLDRRSVTNGSFFGDGAGLSNMTSWTWSKHSPSNSSATASNWTISVTAGSLYVCFTNGFFGPGTNWLKAALTNF